MVNNNPKKLGIEALNKIRDDFYDKGVKNGCNINTLKYLWEVQVFRQSGWTVRSL